MAWRCGSRAWVKAGGRVSEVGSYRPPRCFHIHHLWPWVVTLQGPRCHCGCPQGCGLPVFGRLPSALGLIPIGFVGASTPGTSLVGWETRHSHVSETPFCGVVFPRQIGGGRAPLGATILSCVTVRAWRPPPLPDKGFGPRARSVLPQCLQLLTLGPHSASFRICVFQGSAVRLGGASLQVPSLPPHPTFAVEAAHLPGLVQEAPHKRIPTCKRLHPCVGGHMASC